MLSPISRHRKTRYGRRALAAIQTMGKNAAELPETTTTLMAACTTKCRSAAIATGQAIVEKRMPRLRRLCEEEGPAPLRERGILAPPEFLTWA